MSEGAFGGGGVAGVPPAPVTPERIAQIRKIVSSDIRTAYGREATDKDYSYWMEKFTGYNDSGFVTGGQMSSDEYWHRRLLGWQAGGEDVAKFGPYAGGGEAKGRVPPVSSIIN